MARAPFRWPGARLCRPSLASCWRGALAWALVLALLAGGPPRSRAAAPGTVDAAVTTALAALPPGEQLDVIVLLAEQATLTPPTAQSRATRLTATVLALQAQATASQADLLLLLARQQRQGQVSRVTPLWIVNAVAVSGSAAAIAELAQQPEVGRITLDERWTAEGPTPSLAAAPLAAVEPNIALVGAPTLWARGHGGQGVVVATLDSGVDLAHPDLAAQWRGGGNSWFDPYGEHPTTPADLWGHGTWTMGVMVGGSAGGSAVGMAPQAQWIAARIFDDRRGATTSAVHQAFQWLLDPDGDPATPDAPQVVNCSWSIVSVGCSLTFQPDLQALRAAGIVPVFAAGNSGPASASSLSPANNPEALAVGATDGLDQLWASSSRGPSACGEAETIFPELTAPGVAIRTTDRWGGYAVVTGTSLAAPHVAGALALLLSAHPDLTVAEQEQLLREAALDLGVAGPDNDTGWGRVDVLAAYEALLARRRVWLPWAGAGWTAGW